MRNDARQRAVVALLRAAEPRDSLDAAWARSYELRAGAQEMILVGRETCVRMDATLARLRGDRTAG